MKIAAAAVLGIILVFLGVQIYSFWGRERRLKDNFSGIEMQLTKARADEENLQSELNYLANPLNLEKELRARFDYRKPGENMIIIVPGASSSAGATPANHY